MLPVYGLNNGFIFIFLPGRHRGRGRGTGRGTGRGKGGGRNSHQTLTGTDPIAQRLLSASKQKVNELHNEIDELKKQLKLMEDENKLFKRLHHKQVLLVLLISTMSVHGFTNPWCPVAM